MNSQINSRVLLSQFSKTYNLSPVLLTLFIVLFGAFLPAHANLRVGQSAGCGNGGIINEHVNGRASFVVHLTDNMGQRVGPFTDSNGGTWPRSLAGTTDPLGAATTASVRFPGAPGICDAINEIVRGGGGLGGGGGGGGGLLAGNGERAHLHIESLVRKPGSNEAEIEGIWSRILIEVGAGIIVSVPDLFADTNGSSILDDGDLLYSVVDLNQYLNSTSSFILGQSFDVVNGKIAGLPGMAFYTSEPNFFPSNLDIGFTGTPYNGTAFALARHDLTAISLPPTYALFVVGLFALGWGRLLR